jgi:hypothetical protein
MGQCASVATILLTAKRFDPLNFLDRRAARREGLLVNFSGVPGSVVV